MTKFGRGKKCRRETGGKKIRAHFPSGAVSSFIKPRFLSKNSAPKFCNFSARCASRWWTWFSFAIKIFDISRWGFALLLLHIYFSGRMLVLSQLAFNDKHMIAKSKAHPSQPWTINKINAWFKNRCQWVYPSNMCQNTWMKQFQTIALKRHIQFVFTFSITEFL